MKKYFGLFLVPSLVVVLFSASFSASPPVRVKDIAHVLEARDNQLMGFGLVVGLKHTGDSAQTGFTKQALTNLLNRMGVVPQNEDFRSRNVAAVMVVANIPAFLKPGQKIDVLVSSVGDATSLKGGTLLQTPLMGADNDVYAVSQGPLTIGDGGGGDYYPTVKSGHTTTARVPYGAVIEKEIPVVFDSKKITVVLDSPDFTTASRLAASIAELGYDARAIDAATVTVPVFKGESPVEIIANIENATVVPDVVAKVVINEKTGIVVIGENVRMAPVAVSFRGFSVSVGSMSLLTTKTEGGDDPSGNETSNVKASISTGGGVKALSGAASISDLVKSLNALGASPKDLIAILQSIKKAGALPAEIEIIS